MKNLEGIKPFEEQLEPLPYPVYFICKDTKNWQTLIDSQMPPSVETIDSIDQRISANGRACWIVQTYIYLKRRGLDVYLVSDYYPDKICVVAYDDLKIKDFAFNSYVVVCRADRARPMICEERIVQNKLSVIDHTDHFLPHWPQPNLIPRDESRGTRIENIIYQGLPIYLAEPFKSEKFQEQLKQLGVNLLISNVIKDPVTNQIISTTWNDYSQADLVLAVRNATEYDLSIKPPSKLINAWLAKCPALLGPESAYQQIRHSDLDYIEVRSPQDVIEAIKHLRSHPELYSAMIESGTQRAKDFNADANARRWRNLLAGEIASGYEQWMRQSKLKKFLGRPINYLGRIRQHQREKQYFFIHINQGMRLFSDSEKN